MQTRAIDNATGLVDATEELSSLFASTEHPSNLVLNQAMARTKQTSRKRKSSEYDSDDGFVENDGHGDRSVKRTKPTSTQSQPQTDSDGNTFWEISKMRRVTLSEFKGKLMVSVREYYEQDGEVKPGKKVLKTSHTGVCQ